MDPVKRTVTDKLCDQARARVWSKLEKDYEKAFVGPPAGDEFFTKLDELFGKLDGYLQERPITKAQLLSVTRRAEKAFLSLIKIETKKTPQPRMREVIHMQTGESRWITEYD